MTTPIEEQSTFDAEVPRLETYDPVLGGDDGPDNRAPRALANRTRWLRDRLDALDLNVSLVLDTPLEGLPLPLVAASDRRLGITRATAAAGGVVSVAAGQRITLAASVVAGETGRLLSLATPAWTSSDIPTNAIYYLRAQVADGALVLYLQGGSEADPVPAGLLGTPGAAAGGGFPSTRLDCRLARVETAAAGTLPVLVRYHNPINPRLGEVADYAAADSLPPGWLPCDGRSLSRAEYPELFAMLGTLYGSPSGSTFALPDRRGVFVRGLDSGRGIDAGRALGTEQAGAIGAHEHTAGTLAAASAGSHSHAPGTLASASAGSHSHSATAALQGGQLSRDPYNLANYYAAQNSAITTASAGAHTHTISGATASAGAHTHTISGATASTGGAENYPRNTAALFAICAR